MRRPHDFAVSSNPNNHDYYFTISEEAATALPGQAVSFIPSTKHDKPRRHKLISAHSVITKTLSLEKASRTIYRAPQRGRIQGTCEAVDNKLTLVTPDGGRYPFKLPQYHQHKHITPNNGWVFSCKLTKAKKEDTILTAYHILIKPQHTLHDDAIIPLPIIRHLSYCDNSDNAPTIVIGQLNTGDLPFQYLLHSNTNPHCCTLDDLLQLYVNTVTYGVIKPHETATQNQTVRHTREISHTTSDQLFHTFPQRARAVVAALNARIPINIIFSNTAIDNTVWTRLVHQHWGQKAQTRYRVRMFHLVGPHAHPETTTENFYQLNPYSRRRITTNPDTVANYTVFTRPVNYDTTSNHDGIGIRQNTSPSHTQAALFNLETHSHTIQATKFPSVIIDNTITTHVPEVDVPIHTRGEDDHPEPTLLLPSQITSHPKQCTSSTAQSPLSSTT